MLLGLKASASIPDHLYARMDGDVGMGCLLLGLKASVSITDYPYALMDGYITVWDAA